MLFCGCLPGFVLFWVVTFSVHVSVSPIKIVSAVPAVRLFHFTTFSTFFFTEVSHLVSLVHNRMLWNHGPLTSQLVNLKQDWTKLYKQPDHSCCILLLWDLCIIVMCSGTTEVLLSSNSSQQSLYGSVWHIFSTITKIGVFDSFSVSSLLISHKGGNLTFTKSIPKLASECHTDVR